MKKYYITLVVASVCTLLSSCNDYLDKLPDNRMTFNSPSEVGQLLVTAYPQTHPAYLLEMYSDNTDEMDNPLWSEAAPFQRQAYKWQDITEVSDPETPQELWNTHYKAIATANEAIQYIDGLSDKTSFNAQLGEALLCRAFAMFQLSTVFCQAYKNEAAAQAALGLPYPEKPETQIGVTYERGTLAQLYQKIDADLQRGLSLVRNDYKIPKFHFTTAAANAFAARFYLYYQKYDKAVEYATKVLGSDATNKLRDWNAWSKLQPNEQIQPNAYINSNEKANLLLLVVESEWGAIGGPYRYGDKYSHGRMLSSEETLQAKGPWGESSSAMNYVVFSNSALAKYILRKIPYSFEYTDKTAGIGSAHAEYSVFNTDETLMVRAEANALLGNYAAALADVNTELARFSKSGITLTLPQIQSFYNGIAYYTPTAPTPKKQFHTSFTIESTTQEPLLQCILQLRRLLTIHEGLRLQDVKRYGITMYRRRINAQNDIEAVTDTMQVDDPRLAIQIPQDVITAGLAPNPRN